MDNGKNLLKMFSIPIICSLSVLVVAIFAKNTTVQRTMSLAQTKTITCTSSNYSSRTSDSVCGDGYRNTGNTCTKTTNYSYSCTNSNHTLSGETCSYNATERYSCRKAAVEATCLCVVTYENPGGLGASDTRSAGCGGHNSCSEACQALVGTYAIVTSIPSIINQGNCSPQYTCEEGTLNSTWCYLYQQTSCNTNEGWTKSYTSYSCPAGGTANTSTGKCTYDATKTATGTTYSGTISCELTNFRVEYDGNGGTGTTEGHTCEYDGDCNLKANGFVREGYIFKGWKKENAGDTLNPGTSIKNVITSGTVTYYAQWEACPAGTYAAAGATSCSPCTENTYTSSDGQSSCMPCPEGTTVNDTHTACVEQAPETYTVRYDKNNENATGTTNDSTHTIGVEKALNLNGYRLGGHIFVGWTSNADGTGTNYTDGQSVVDLSTENNVVVTIYAKWEACPAGTYAAPGATSCSPCAGNTYTSSEGQSSCDACPDEYNVNETHTACVVPEPPIVSCPAGTYLIAGGTTEDDCTLCPEGYYCPGGDFEPDDEDQGKDPCPEGHINGGTGLSTENSCMIRCNDGYYKDDEEASACVVCPVDTTSNSHLVNYGQVSPDGTCYKVEKEYKCYLCKENGKDTYRWTSDDLNSNINCAVDVTKNSSAKCKKDEEPSNPKTGLIGVGGLLLGLSAIGGTAYIILKKKEISNM